jgi:hypothetical protein
MGMNKRQFLKGLSLAIGASAAAHMVASGRAVEVALAYTPRDDTLEQDGKVLNRDQLRTLHAVCTHVIPASDTPGAADLDVHGFMDNQLFHCHGEQEQERVRGILDTLDRQARASLGAAFADSAPSDQLVLLQALDSGQAPFNSGETGQFRYLKYGIAFGYYTTEVGATRELRFVPYPGGFKGSIPWSEEDRDYFS